MAVWSGLGVNYRASQPSWAADMAYFKSIGLKNVRMYLGSAPISWSMGDPTQSNGYNGTNADQNAYWRLAAQSWTAAGFWVSWGTSYPSGTIGSLTSSTWPGFHDSVVAEASYLQSQGTAFGAFELGNELEVLADNYTLSWSQVRSNIRQLAIDVKAVYSLSPINYAATNIGGTNYAGWASEGMGALDTIGIHPYGAVETAQGYSYQMAGDFANMPTMFTAFGSKCYISEFNLDPSESGIAKLTPEQQMTSMRRFWAQLRATSAQRAIVYSWNTEPVFEMQNTDGSFSPLWDVLLGNDRRTFVP